MISARPTPYPVDMPMLHGVTDITGLDDVFNHNGGLAIHRIARAFLQRFGNLGSECPVPPSISKLLEFLVRDVRLQASRVGVRKN